jgi:hypothetical protein
VPVIGASWQRMRRQCDCCCYRWCFEILVELLLFQGKPINLLVLWLSCCCVSGQANRAVGVDQAVIDPGQAD